MSKIVSFKKKSYTSKSEKEFNKTFSGFSDTEDLGKKDWNYNSNRFLYLDETVTVVFQETSAIKQRLNQLEKDVNLLKTTRPRIEEVDTNKEALFAQLQNRIECLLSNFEDLDLRLKYFIDLKNELANLNKETRKWNEVYLLRSIVVFYDSIKHSFAEDLSKKQGEVIKEIGKIIANEVVDRNRFREIYKKLKTIGFQIIPEPTNIEKK